MLKHGGTPSRRDQHVTPAAISPPGVARGRFVGGQQSGLAGCKPPPIFMRGASSCSSQGRRQGEPRGASARPSAPSYLPTLRMVMSCWVAGDRVNHLVCCAMVLVGFQSVRVSSPRYRGHTLKWSQVSSSAWPQMHLVYLAGTWVERRVYHRWYRVRRGSCSRASWSQGFCRCAVRLSGRRAE